MITLYSPQQQRTAVQLLRAARLALASAPDLADALEIACSKVADRAARRVVMMIVSALWLEVYAGGRPGSAAELVCNLVSVLVV